MAKVLVMFYDSPEIRTHAFRKTVSRKEVSTVSELQDLLEHKPSGTYLAYYYRGNRLSYREAFLALGMKPAEFNKIEDNYRSSVGLSPLNRSG